MRYSSLAAALLAAVTLASCAGAPVHYKTAPSTVAVRTAIATTRSEIGQATAAATHIKLALASASPADFSNSQSEIRTSVDSLTAHLLAAKTANEQTEARVAQLDTAIAKQSAETNANAARAEAEHALAAKYKKWRNRFLLAAVALLVWVFRGQILSVLSVAVRAAITFFAPYLAPALGALSVLGSSFSVRKTA